MKKFQVEVFYVPAEQWEHVEQDSYKHHTYEKQEQSKVFYWVAKNGMYARSGISTILQELNISPTRCSMSAFDGECLNRYLVKSYKGFEVGGHAIWRSGERVEVAKIERCVGFRSQTITGKKIEPVQVDECMISVKFFNPTYNEATAMCFVDELQPDNFVLLPESERTTYKAAFACKVGNEESYLSEIRHPNGQVIDRTIGNARVCAVMTLSKSKYSEFIDDILGHNPFEGKEFGGTYCVGDLAANFPQYKETIDEVKNNDLDNWFLLANIMDKDPEFKNFYYAHAVDECVKVTDGDRWVLVSPQGYSYVRHIAFSAYCRKIHSFYQKINLNNSQSNIKNTTTMNEEQMIIEQGRIEGNKFYLPDYQIDRKLYLKVAKILGGLGGKWKGGRTKAFIFDKSPENLISEYLEGNGDNLRKKYQFFPTPDKVCQLLVENLDANSGHTVLEPSAGNGSLISALLARVEGLINVDYCEIWDAQRFEIATNIPQANCVGFDFLELEEKPLYDRIIANPPFSKNQDIKHVMKMWGLLKEGGRLVSVMSKHYSFAKDKASKQFREFLDEQGGEVIELEGGEFAESGTQISTHIVIIDK